jgi:hypothetical protein
MDLRESKREVDVHIYMYVHSSFYFSDSIRYLNNTEQSRHTLPRELQKF